MHLGAPRPEEPLTISEIRKREKGGGREGPLWLKGGRNNTSSVYDFPGRAETLFQNNPGSFGERAEAGSLDLLCLMCDLESHITRLHIWFPRQPLSRYVMSATGISSFCSCWSPSLVASRHTEELACLQFSLLAAVSILQNRQAVNSIQSKVVTMFSVVLTQPMALEECSSLNS